LYIGGITASATILGWIKITVIYFVSYFDPNENMTLQIPICAVVKYGILQK
jgi:hypothetical protein